MSTKKIFAAALLALAPFAAQASLTTLPAESWPPAGSTGLKDVQFNVVNLGNGAFVAMGAHGYKNSVLLPNDGSSVFTAAQGVYAGDNKNYANWSFDFAYNTGGCTSCSVLLEVDTDPGASTRFVQLWNLSAWPTYGNVSGKDSWNMEMGFINFLTGYDFNPHTASSTAFRLSLINNEGFAGVSSGASQITVNVPEPGTFSLAALAIGAMALVRRRRKN